VADVNRLIADQLPAGVPNEGTWAYKVLMAVVERGTAGATDSELAAILQAPGGLNNIRARRNGLVAEGLLEDSGQQRETSTGSAATVWTLDPKLRRSLWPTFSTADCTFAASTSGTPAAAMSSRDRRTADQLRARLALLARQAMRAAEDAGTPASGDVDDDGFTVTIHPDGSDPERAWVDVTLDGSGMELALYFADADEDEIGNEEAARRMRLRRRFARLETPERDQLEALVADGWSAEVLSGGGPEESGSFDDWLDALTKESAFAAQVVRRFDPSDLDAQGTGIADVLKRLAVPALAALATATSGAGDPVAILVETLHWDEEQAQRLLDLVSRSRQLLFAGPPGTGKTLTARTLASVLGSPERVRLVQFHPTYAYEDFVEGIRPRLDHDELTYELRRGVIRELIDDAAAADVLESYFLIVDEINRANLPRVLGELLFGLEYRGPGNEVKLPYSGDETYIPENIWLIGTMNTADRSVALMDAAMRRRFKEFRFDVDYEALRRWHAKRTSSDLGDEAARRLQRLNDEVTTLLDEDRAIGHSFLMRTDLPAIGFETVWREDLEPVLRDHLLGRTDDLPALEDAFLGEL
jgi:5-methylcytosine-specific restriction enzyme B